MNDTQDHVELDEINIFQNYFRLIRNIHFKDVEYCKFFYRTNIMKKRNRLTLSASRM